MERTLSTAVRNDGGEMTETSETKVARIEERQDALAERVEKLEETVESIRKTFGKMSTTLELDTWTVGGIIGALPINV